MNNSEKLWLVMKGGDHRGFRDYRDQAIFHRRRHRTKAPFSDASDTHL
jgi:hypothetical protein